MVEHESPPRLELRGVAKRFHPIDAVENFSLCVGAGEFVALVGSSGSGKTTLLRLVCGLEAADRGVILIDGQAVSDPRILVPPQRRGLAVVFQDFALWPNMTVAQNIAFGLKARLPARDVGRRVRAILDKMGLARFHDSSPATLSGGEQQRVALARALALEPKILLFDEPLSNLDNPLRLKITEEILRLVKEERITALYATHQMDEALTLGDRVVVLESGRIVQADTPAGIWAAPRTADICALMGLTNSFPGLVLDAGRAATPLGEIGGAFAGFSGSVTIVIRPEHVQVAADGPFPGQVIGPVYRGVEWLYQARVRDATIAFRSPAPLSAGQTVRLRIDTAKLLVF